MWGRPVSGDRHVLVNRDLSLEFAAFLAAAEWDVALLQEVPPRWAGPLAEATGSSYVRTLTSRNWIRPFTFPLARVRPHLVGSWEGGSNLILLRQGQKGLGITDRRSKALSLRPERRTVTMVRLENGLCIANLHAGTGRRATEDVIRATRLATDWAGEAPLVLAGDFNAWPRSSDLFRQLESGFGLTGETAPDAIDHILTRDVPDPGPARSWPPERRDVPDERSELMIRLSDHPPVARKVNL